MLGARRQVDGKALAQLVQGIARAWMLALGDLDGVDGAGQRDGRLAAALQFGIDELDVEAGIVDHQRGIAQELQEFFDHMREDGLVGQEVAGQAVDAGGLDRHIAFGVQVELQRAAGGKMIQQLDAADFHDPVALARLEARRFRVEDDLTHWLIPCRSRSRECGGSVCRPGSFSPVRGRDPGLCQLSPDNAHARAFPRHPSGGPAGH